MDGASPALQSIRAEFRRLRERVVKTLEEVLRRQDLQTVVQDDFITCRGDRYVIPMRTDFRGAMEGIIHDRSRTGATFFVEPLAVVELNNKLSVLREEEEVEIRRILTGLTRLVGEDASRIRGNLAVVAFFDELAARLRLARRLGCTRPELVDAPLLELRRARHPVLQLQKGGDVVPVDLRIGGGTRLLLVTGANAGGKTVALKTAGLLTLMARAGLFVPADEGSRVGWFDDVYADIGDEQDIDRNLSTFSAHVSHLRDVLDLAGEGALVLLDELGTGTDPNEGAALGQAVVEALLAAGALVLATTHLSALKTFAYTRPEAEIAAVAFDAASGRPLFRLVYGYSGTSNALDVAETLGLPALVVSRARVLAAAGSDAASELLLGIDRVRKEAVETSERAEELRREWERKLAEQRALVDEARRERDGARSDARRDVAAVIEEARTSLRRTIADFARRETSQKEAEKAVQAAEQKLEEALRPEEPQPVRPPVGRLEPGVGVFVPSFDREGVVEALDPEGARATVLLGGLRVKVSVEELRQGTGRSPGGRARPSSSPARLSGEPPARELVVVGCTVEEALAKVDLAVDRALVAGVDSLRVVHGRGTGALRRGIREHLTGAPHVRAVRAVQGDEAATWVDLE